MSQENLEKVRRAFDAMNRGELDESLTYFAPTGEWHTTGRFADARVYRGHPGLEKVWGELREDMEKLRFAVSDIRDVGEDKVFVAGAATGRGKGSKAEVEDRLWYVVTLRDGLILRVETYTDSAQALEAAGRRE